MSYNPARLDSNRNLHQRTAPPLGAGMTRASIMNKQQNGQHRVPAGQLVQTICGQAIALCDSPGFVVRFETMHARTTSGAVVHTDGDRTIYVTRGSVFVLIKNEAGKLDQLKVLEGQHVNLPRGTEYELATSGDFGVDFIVVETPDYDKTVQKLTAPTVGDGAKSQALDSLQSAPTVVRRDVDPRTMAQAQEMAAVNTERRRRAAQRADKGEFNTNANSAAVTGVSPMPSGPPREE